jgi:hypothetical protein
MSRVTIQGRTFEAGDVTLNDKAKLDVGTEREVDSQGKKVKVGGVLFPGPDHANIVVLSDGRIGYEVNHSNPADPFRWTRLQEIVGGGHVKVIGLNPPGSVANGFLLAERVGSKYKKELRQLVLILPGSLPKNGLTLPRLAVEQEINPNEEKYEASPRENVDTIYYLSTSGPLGGKTSLAHELFGHDLLAIKRVNWSHPRQLPSDTAPIARVLANKELDRLGTLRKKDGIKDPFGRVFEGLVETYIEHFINSRSDPLDESPTQRVSETYLKQSLDEFFRAALLPGGLSEKGDMLSKDALSQFTVLSKNYFLLQFSKEPTATQRLTGQGVVGEIVRRFTQDFNKNQKLIFRAFVDQVTQIDRRSPAQRTIDLTLAVELRSRLQPTAP